MTDRPLPRWLVPDTCRHCGRAIRQPVEGRTREFCDDRCRVNDWRAYHGNSDHWCGRCRGEFRKHRLGPERRRRRDS